MWMRDNVIRVIVFGIMLHLSSFAFAEDVVLQDLIAEALKNNPDILAAQAKAEAARYRVPQAKSLPDPMVMFGYQNEGWDRYTYGDMPDAQWMFSASQMFPFPGKRALKGEMAEKEWESLGASYEATRLRIIAQVKGLYYDLFLAYKDVDLTKDKAGLVSRVEETVLARYSSGMAPQQEVIMAQTEKYMLLEREEMFTQRIQAVEAMLNSFLGRDVKTPVDRPSEPSLTEYNYSLEELLNTALERSPEIRVKAKMIAGAEAKLNMAKKEYYPDFTLSAGMDKRRGMFDDMWNLTTTINIPIYFRTKQRQGVFEAQASVSEANKELEATKVMINSAIRDNYSMLRTAERLSDLHMNVMIPKIYQDFEASIAGYATGQVEAITVITRLNSLLDHELQYWEQLTQRVKAVARLEALTGTAEAALGVK